MKKLGIGAAGLILGTAGLFGTHAMASAEAHTPVIVCHYVPAAPAGSHMIPGPNGGSYEVIIVDDNASTGNKNGKGHAGHGDDIFGDPTCGHID